MAANSQQILPSFSLIQGQIEPNSPRIRAHIDAENRKQSMCVETQVCLPRALSKAFCVPVVRRLEAETRSNQMHFTIEFQAGEKESDSHLRGKREKKIWERETRGVSRSAATVSVCLMLIERCAVARFNYCDRLRASLLRFLCASNISRLFFILLKKIHY